MGATDAGPDMPGARNVADSDQGETDIDWARLTPADALARFDSSSDGLDDAVAASRLAEIGPANLRAPRLSACSSSSSSQAP